MRFPLLELARILQLPYRMGRLRMKWLPMTSEADFKRQREDFKRRREDSSADGKISSANGKISSTDRKISSADGKISSTDLLLFCIEGKLKEARVIFEEIVLRDCAHVIFCCFELICTLSRKMIS